MNDDERAYQVDRIWSYCLPIAIGMIVVSAAFTLLCMVLVQGLKAEDSDPLCDYFAELANQPGVEVAEWIGYPEGWQGYPQTWDYETLTMLGRENAILSKTKGNQRWLWAFRSLKEDNGNHDFCEHVLIVSDAP